MRLWHFVFCLFVPVAVAIPHASGLQSTQSPPFVPGEVIVKFSKDSKAGNILARAAKANWETDACLASYLSALSQELGIPLNAKQLTSGGELVLAIQTHELTAKLVAHLKRNPRVLRTMEVESDKKGGMGAPRIEVLVEFAAGSHESTIISRALSKGLNASSSLQELTAELERGLGFKLESRATKNNQLAVVIKVDSLTLDLAARLNKRADVEYAQPNFVLQKLSSHV